MVGKTRQRCSFAIVLLYVDIADYTQYMSMMKPYPLMCEGVTHGAFRRVKRQENRFFKSSVNYYQGVMGKREFFRHFNLESWSNLPAEEKNHHRFKECLNCQTKQHKYAHEFLKKNRKSKLDINLPLSQITSRIIQKEHATQYIMNKIDPLFHSRYGSTFASTFLKPIEKKKKEECVSEAISTIGNSIVSEISTAVLSHNISYKTIGKIQRRINLDENRKQKSIPLSKDPEMQRKEAIINHENFVFDRDAVRRHINGFTTRYVSCMQLVRKFPVMRENGLTALNGPKVLQSFVTDLGFVDDTLPPLQKGSYKIKHYNYIFNRDSFTKYVKDLETTDVNWSELARKFPVTQKNGKRALNGDRVLKEYATELGLVKWKLRKRRKVRQITVEGINVSLGKLFPSECELRETARKQISCGEIEIGTPVVATTTKHRKVGEGGRMETKDVTTVGRAFTLQQIMDRSLLEQEERGVLRLPYPENHDITVALTELRTLGINVKADTIEELNEQIATRMFAVWLDHSTIASHSHLLVLVSFIYDPLVYKTDAECAESIYIEGLVEKPYVYIFARSDSSVDKQSLYNPLRVQHLLSLKPSTTKSGVRYTSVNRLGIGDSPARAFESGNQINGRFPCHCGTEAQLFPTFVNIEKPKFLSIKDRLAIFKETLSTEDQAEDAVSLNTTKAPLRSNMDNTHCNHNQHGNESELSGIKRPPALLCTDHDIELGRYEIAQLEPLHDLKTIIGNVFKEMIYVVPKDLKKKLLLALPEMQGHRYEISGSNARLSLVRMRCFFETSEECENENTRRVRRLVSNLGHIQDLAYAVERRRTACNILAMYNLTYVFSIDYCQLFRKPRQMTTRGMFGMAYHSITSHFPEWYRIVPLRSMNAENQERFFKDIKNITRTSSNFHPDHIIENSLSRLDVKSKQALLGQSFAQQEGKISREWRKLAPRDNTIITKDMVDENVQGFEAHKRRIADYLLDSCWHKEDKEGNWLFYDGAETMQEKVSPSVYPMHLRYSQVKDVWKHIESSSEMYEKAMQDGAENRTDVPDLAFESMIELEQCRSEDGTIKKQNISQNMNNVQLPVSEFSACKENHCEKFEKAIQDSAEGKNDLPNLAFESMLELEQCSSEDGTIKKQNISQNLNYVGPHLSESSACKENHSEKCEEGIPNQEIERADTPDLAVNSLAELEHEKSTEETVQKQCVSPDFTSERFKVFEFSDSCDEDNYVDQKRVEHTSSSEWLEMSYDDSFEDISYTDSLTQNNEVDEYSKEDTSGDEWLEMSYDRIFENIGKTEKYRTVKKRVIEQPPEPAVCYKKTYSKKRSPRVEDAEEQTAYSLMQSQYAL